MGNKFYSFLRGLLYAPVKLIFPVRVIGKENLPLPDKIITVSNHLTSLDIVLVAINVKGYRHIIAKKELTKSKFFAAVMNKAGVIPVDRGKADLSAMRKTLAALKAGEGITIFPEGTRNKGGEQLQEVKAGAALFALKGGADVVPIMILHRQRAFRRNYICIGKPFSVAEAAAGGGSSSAAVERASRVIEHEMRETREFLVDYVENKRAAEYKRERKAAARRTKAYEKEGKAARKSLRAHMKKCGL